MPDNSSTQVTDISKWDGAAFSLVTFLPELRRALPKLNAKYRRLVEYRYVSTSRSTCCMSLNHIDRIITKSITPGSFQSPFEVDINTFEDLLNPDAGEPRG